MNPLDFSPLYDFSLIEQAVQKFFCSFAQSPFVAPPNKQDGSQDEQPMPQGQVAFYTAFQAATFQKYRPRVGIAMHSVNEFQGMDVIPTATNVFTASGWRGQMRFNIITGPDYDYHRQLRATILAILPMTQPQLNPDGSGIGANLNALLQYHEIGTFEMQNEATTITPQSGYYRSDINANLTFSVKVSAWPGGLLTN